MRLPALLLIAIFVGGGFVETDPQTKNGTVELDVPYVDGGGNQQKLDRYLPDQKAFPTIVFTYGGGWHTGSRKSVTPIGVKFQSLDFGCALLSHRLGPQDKFSAQIEDVAAAFAWVKKNIRARGGNPTPVFRMGHSSGAHLSLLLAADPKYFTPYKLAPADIAGVIGLSSPVDLEPRADKKGFGDALMAGKGADVFSRGAALMKGASPIQHVSRYLPPTSLIVGDRDFPMLGKDAKTFAEKAKRVGLNVGTYTAKDCDHMAVARNILGEESPVREQIVTFLTKPKGASK